MDAIELGVVDDEDELAAYTDVLADCFATSSSEEKIAEWVACVPEEDRRVARRGGEVVGSVVQVPMGQWFGGRSVRTMGVAGVGVPPTERGTGLATEMMRRALIDWRAAGYPLSTLYPSTYRLYQGVGYERAGGRYVARVELSEVDVRERGLRTAPWAREHTDEIDALHAAWGRANPGNLDRGPYIWDRIERPRGTTSEGVLFVDGDGRAEGYAFYVRSDDADVPYRISVLDVAVSTPRAARAFLAFLGGFRTIARLAAWASAPGDPILAHLPERFYELVQKDQWMLRVLDVPGALEARGYAPGVEVELSLAVRDDVLPANAGPWTLRVADGVGRVEAGGDGRLSLDVRGLAALYTGHLSPEQLYLAGGLEGAPEDRAAAAAAFAGPAPFLKDDF